MSFNPKQQYPARAVTQAGWVFRPATDGTFTNETIRTAALVMVADELKAINNKIDALGADGIHRLIREALTETRAKRRSRLSRRKVKP